MSKRLQLIKTLVLKSIINMLGFKKENKNKSELKETAFKRIMDTVSNRRRIQHLRKLLFQSLDYTPKNIKKYNIDLAKTHESWYEIITTSNEILNLIHENNWVYKFYISNNQFDDLLLNGESKLFDYEKFYEQYLEKFINDKLLKEQDEFSYYQKLYDFIIYDLTYGDIYDYSLSSLLSIGCK